MVILSRTTPGPPPAKPVTIVIVGAGQRGALYAEYAKYFPKWLQVVAVCDHHDFKCAAMAKDYGIPPENVFVGGWEKMVVRGKMADAIAICTTDRDHVEPAVAFANLKYHILLEKPMAVSVQDCVRIYEAVKENGVFLAVGHVLRYTKYTQTLMQILDSKVIGEIINVQHLEPVGFWHFAHSFVRGNWGNEQDSTFSLLSKSCHDIDLIAYYMSPNRCKKISSFGNLTHFRKDKKPVEAGEAQSCLECPAEKSCPYSAKKIYIDPFVTKGWTSWPVDVVQPNGIIDIENLTHALQTTKYGKCVYEVNNDVCDHQVVAMEFDNGATASFSMIAFTEAMCERKTKIFGSRGEIEGDGVDFLKVFNFETRTSEVFIPSQKIVSELPASGHGGGDYGLLQSFLNAIVSGDEKNILSGPLETLDSHIYVFAAEEARRTGTVVDMEAYRKKVALN